MDAVEAGNEAALGQALIAHAGHVLRNLRHSLLGAPVLGRPPDELRDEARLIAQLSAQYSLTVDLAMGLLGGQLKRMELLSARLGDVLAHLYLASACVWRYEADGRSAMLPFAQAAIRQQLLQARSTLQAVHANLPSPAARWLGWASLRGLSSLTPLLDGQWLALAETLRSRRDVVNQLCPDLSVPRQGGLFDLMDALAMGALLGDDAHELNKVLRRTRSLQATADGAPDPAMALRYLKAADRVIQVDDVPFDGQAEYEPDQLDLDWAASRTASGVMPVQRRTAR